MTKRRGTCAAFLFYLLVATLAPVAQADLYRAEAAYQKKDFAAAFRLFREIAELGHPLAQETLAIMYVQGEGVPRDNVLGLAWAQLARENGLGDNVQPIIDQLEPHMTPEARKTITGIHEKFGAEARRKWLPAQSSEAPAGSRPKCVMKQPANPDKYFPPEAIEAGVDGSVVVNTIVMPDGRARNPPSPPTRSSSANWSSSRSVPPPAIRSRSSSTA